jgi:hypothetical protein
MQDRAPTIGFIGLGVMGGPMCRNVARKHAGAICAFDLNEVALRDVAAAGVRCARSVAEVAGASDIIFLSLPAGKQVEEVCFGKEGVAVVGRRGLIVVDLSDERCRSRRWRVTPRSNGVRGRAVARPRTRRTPLHAWRDEALFTRINRSCYMGSDVTASRIPAAGGWSS